MYELCPDPDGVNIVHFWAFMREVPIGQNNDAYLSNTTNWFQNRYGCGTFL